MNSCFSCSRLSGNWNLRFQSWWAAFELVGHGGKEWIVGEDNVTLLTIKAADGGMVALRGLLRPYTQDVESHGSNWGLCWCERQKNQILNFVRLQDGSIE